MVRPTKDPEKKPRRVTITDLRQTIRHRDERISDLNREYELHSQQLDELEAKLQAKTAELEDALKCWNAKLELEKERADTLEEELERTQELNRHLVRALGVVTEVAF